MNRLDELSTYNILDTPPEKELDEISELASLICGVPISLITILDEDRQWFKSKKGLEQNETALSDSFCQHTLHKPKEVLVVEDSWKDSRFINNKLVLGDPKIRFYAGAPLETPSGNVLGTLCVIDRKPRNITENQKKALQMLAAKAMDYLEFRKLLIEQNETIQLSTSRLNKLTQNVPGGIFQLRVTQNGTMNFEFLSEGIKDIHPTVDLKDWLNDPTIGFSLMHPEDIEPLKARLASSVKHYTKLHHEYRVKSESGVRWHAILAQPEKDVNGDTIFYGTFSDITHHREYEAAMEQISFDISHILRRPVASLLGLTRVIESAQNITTEELKEYAGYIKTASKELENFTRQLNEVYQEKKLKIIDQNTEPDQRIHEQQSK